VRDAAVMLMTRAYGSKPDKLYFVGSSEGGREGLTMAQRYPDDFDGIFARVPVINWVGLQHAGTRAGLATMGDGWIRPAQVKLVHDAVLAACDAQDGVADALVEDAVGCKARFDPAKLLCARRHSGDQCLSEAQLAAIRTLLSPYKFSFALANGVSEYPGWGVSGEATKSYGPTGGWSAWWLGAAPPALPPQPNNGIAWDLRRWRHSRTSSRAIRFRQSRKYRPEDFAERVREVSALMDSTNPDLGRVQGPQRQARHPRTHGRLRQSPYAGDRLFSGGAEAHG
jgi:feruloyl esterase